MANAFELMENLPVRGFLAGYPGSAKTGSLAPLINAGFKVRLLMYDKVSNLQPLFVYANHELLKRNVDIVVLEDKMRIGASYVEPAGIPTAFAEGMKMLNHWTYKDSSGDTVDLGHSSEWGSDTIVVVDSITSMGEASLRRATKLANRTPVNRTDAVYGLAMSEQTEFVRLLFSSGNKHHSLLTAHLKLVGPREPRKGDSDITKQVKEQVAQLVNTRLFPSALGWQLPQFIGGEAPIILRYDTQYRNGQVKRIIRTTPSAEFDVKLPGAEKLPATLDVSDGLLKIFEALSPGSVALAKKNLAP